MNNEAYDYGLGPAGDIVLSMVWGVMILEFLSVIVMILSAMMLYKNTKRPGTLLIIIGISIATLIYFSVAILENLAYEFIFNEFVTWGFSLAQALSIFIACIGFLQYSRSYNHEA